MPGFRNHQELVEAELNGQTFYSSWRKSPTAGAGVSAGIWFDWSMQPGMPTAQFYASSPLTAMPLAYSTDGGLWSGRNVSPAKKFLKRIMGMTPSAAVPLYIKMLDYLLYYPFADESITDVQTMTNVNTIPRYPTGAGVQIMPVMVGAQQGGGAFTVSYTNSNGVSGRTTPSVATTAVTVVGSIASSINSATANCVAPFLPLQAGDTGVRSIESVTFSSPDVGLLTLVLVRPIAQFVVRGIDAPVEVDFAQDFMTLPQVVDDAYLNFIFTSGAGNMINPILGELTFIWN